MCTYIQQQGKGKGVPANALTALATGAEQPLPTEHEAGWVSRIGLNFPEKINLGNPTIFPRFSSP